jgi:mRNA interferase RelE/StbE
MAYRVEVSTDANKQLEKLDRPTRERMIRFILDRLSKLDDPRSIGEALKGTRFGEFWRYRVGDYRLVCRIEDDRLVILVLQIGNWREVYR